MAQNQPSSQRILGKSFLADLDGLLVDSKSFSQLFIQQCDPKWVEAKLDKVAQSDLHLAKLIDVLTHLITSESHPEWVRKALVWLNCFMRKYPGQIRKPRIRNAFKRLCSYVHEISNLEDPYFRAANRSLAIEKWSKSYQATNHIPLSMYYSDAIPIPSTRYVYNDGLKSKPRPAKRKRTKASVNRPPNHMETDDLADELDINSSLGSESESMLKMSEFDPNNDEYDDDDDDDVDDESDESMGSSVESDDGVFDVDTEQSDAASHSHADEQDHATAEEEEDDQNSDYSNPSEQKLLNEDYVVDDLNSTAEESDESADDEDHENDEVPFKLHMEDLGEKSDGDEDDDDEVMKDDTESEEERQGKLESPKSEKKKNKKSSPVKSSADKKAKSKSPKPKSPTQPKSTPPVTRRSLRSTNLATPSDVSSPRTLRNRRSNK